MKLQFKYQKFQADAAKAVADVFDGQPYLAPSYMTGEISGKNSSSEERKGTFSGWSNQKIVPELSDERILDNLRKIQKANQIPVSSKLEGRENGYHLTVEMETGVGKTYTYIKTIYELNKRYGWSKFLVVVPSIAIREGVYKTFQITREHFAKEYGKKIRFFIYNSERLTEIDRFASDNSVHVMIINSQAFNAKGKDARRIYMNLDEFQGRKPIDLIAGTNPIIIIDEPQSVEGRQTKERMKQFCPLITLRYSATHKADSLYNMVYRLSAADAYRKYLVKKIEVKGIAGNGAKGKKMIMELHPDLLFLDVELPDTLGLNLLSEIREDILWDMKVVFYTSYDKYLLQALRESAFDFLLKPFEAEDLKVIMDRYRKAMSSTSLPLLPSFASSISALMPQQGMFMISTVTGFKLLRLEEIGFFEYLKDKRQWQVVLFNQTCLNLKRNTKAEDIISYSQAFVQISQSAIVNVNYLAMIDGKCCQLYPPFHDKNDLIISRSYLKELQERFFVL